MSTLPTVKKNFSTKQIKIEKTREEVNREIEFWFGEKQQQQIDSKLAVDWDQLSGPNFAKKCALLCEKHTSILKDFTGEYGDPLCLNIGCSVGCTTFELSKSFAYVLGMDPCQERISIAEKMKENKKVEYYSSHENDATVDSAWAMLDPNIELGGVHFAVDDPTDLSPNLAPVDCILATNILSRLHAPKRFLKTLPLLLRPNGTVVIVSTYDWDPNITPKHEAIIGYKTARGEVVSSEQHFCSIMTQNGFTKVHQEDIPSARKSNARNFQLCISQATVWRKSSETNL